MGVTGAGMLIIVGGLLVIVVVVAVLLSAQRKRPRDADTYAGRAGTRRPVTEEFYDPEADPEFRGDGLPEGTDTVLRGDLALPDAPPAPPPATDPG
jgi:hypothetical protein